jgi:hypothetical protein
MADDVSWQAEHIPDDDDVYMRAHRVHFRNGELQPGVFRPHGNGMSVDWEKYSSPSQTRERASRPTDNAVIEISVGGIRGVQDLDVLHTPDFSNSNRSHSDVLGLPENAEDLTEVRVLLLDLSAIVLAL